MSSAPFKKPHEDVGGGGGSNSSASSKYPNDDTCGRYSSVGPKLLASTGSSEYIHHHNNPHFHPQSMDHTPQPDPSVLPTIPRSESSDKRQPSIPVLPSPPSVFNDYKQPDQGMSSGLGNRLDSRENPYNRDPKFDICEPGMENRGDKGKDLKFNRELHPSEHKRENVQVDKEGSGSGSGGHMYSKEFKEHHIIKRYTDTPSVDTPSVNTEMCNSSRSNVLGQIDRDVVQKEVLPEHRDLMEAHEATGENNAHLKGEDRLKEQDRKMKEFKQCDLGERDRDRGDHRINLQLSSGGSSQAKESVNEDPEVEKWENDMKKKDIAKDKEKPKEREQEPVMREASNGDGRDGLNLKGEKESMDAVGKLHELESVVTDTKKLRDHGRLKINDNEASRKKERDANEEGERPEKRIRYNDKESVDGCPDAETGSERKRGVLNYGVQKCSPQAANGEQRFSSRTQENEGSQGKYDVSMVTYRAGECMQELLKLWKEYEASQDKIGANSKTGPTLEIRIPAEHVSATNRQVRGGQLWGTDIYTNDSDLVAVLMHTGYCRTTASAPSSAVQELRATIRVLPPKNCYTSTLRNNVRSRAWGAGISCSYGVERCCILKKGGSTIELEPCLTQTSAVEPTLAPVAVERTMAMRAAASVQPYRPHLVLLFGVSLYVFFFFLQNTLRQQRFVREITIQYNLCNEPWIKYSISVVADKGLKKVLYTSARLKKGEVLYLETHTRRYELCFMGEKIVKDNTSQSHDSEQTHRGGSDGDSIDVFRWSCCKSPLSEKVMRRIGIPLPLEHVEVLEENIDWEDIQWSQRGVFMAGKEYLLARAHFVSSF